MKIDELLLPINGVSPNVILGETYLDLVRRIELEFYTKTSRELRESYIVTEKEIIMGEFPEGLAKALQFFHFPKGDTMVLCFFFHLQACAIELTWDVLVERIDNVWERESDMWLAPSSLEWLIEVNHEYFVKLFRPRDAA